jgi:RimJ/RimL family protein N-acetyltransferase
MIGRLELPLTDGAIQLRPFDLDDVGDVTDACQDREISRWTDAVPWPYTEDHARGWISAHPRWWERGEVAPFAIVDADDGSFLGAISLIFPEDRPPAAGYWVARWGRNRGVATAALVVITNWGFDALGLASITLATMLGNVASERVAQKAGFAFIGETSEYRPPRNPENCYRVRTWERKRPSGATPAADR